MYKVQFRSMEDCSNAIAHLDGRCEFIRLGSAVIVRNISSSTLAEAMFIGFGFCTDLTDWDRTLTW